MSNASITTVKPVEAAFLSPLTSMIISWAPGIRLVSLKMGAWISVAEYVSTVEWNDPSRDTRRMPVAGPRKPSNVTVVPVNVSVARAPVVDDAAALPPLQDGARLVGAHPLPNVTAGDESSIRVPRTVGGVAGPTSNASTTTTSSVALGFLRA